jgi:hypothetical protein
MLSRDAQAKLLYMIKIHYENFFIYSLCIIWSEFVEFFLSSALGKNIFTSSYINYGKITVFELDCDIVHS